MSEVDEKGAQIVSTPEEDDLSTTEDMNTVLPVDGKGDISDATPDVRSTDVSSDEDRISNAEVVTDDREKGDISNATPEDELLPDAGKKGAISNPTPEDEETFPRKYVEELRTENGTYRNRAKDAEAKADELAQALWTERVRSLGVLADPTDLPYDPEALDDLELIRSQADELLASKPHLRTRKITERVGQGERGAEAISLVELLQRGA